MSILRIYRATRFERDPWWLRLYFFVVAVIFWPLALLEPFFQTRCDDCGSSLRGDPWEDWCPDCHEVESLRRRIHEGHDYPEHV